MPLRTHLALRMYLLELMLTRVYNNAVLNGIWNGAYKLELGEEA
jgi:hypothetical protein